MTMRISKNRIDMDDKILQKPVLKDYGETVVTANSGTSYTIDLTQGNVFDITLTDDCDFTFANPPASGTAGSFTLMLTQDGTGSRTATWPVAVAWLGGIAPTLSITITTTDILIFATVNGGTTWFGAATAQDYDSTPLPFYLPFGYFGGGQVPANVSTVDRIDYSNDTVAAAVRGPLSAARYYLAATGNSSYGYFGGGAAPAARSLVDRIDYSNDTVAAAAKGPLSLARYYLAATGNSSFGYFGGGTPGTVSTVDRIDYANDTVAATAKGPLFAARYFLAATGTSSYGYFGGGGSAPGTVSTVDRIDYTNDTATAAVRGPLSLARNSPAATGTSSFGYFGGGSAPGARSTVDRIDYSNDTATAAVRGPLSLARYYSAATNHGPV